MTIANPFNCFINTGLLTVLLFIGGISYGLPWSFVVQDLHKTFIVVSYKMIILFIINLKRQHGPVVLDSCPVIGRSYMQVQAIRFGSRWICSHRSWVPLLIAFCK